MNRGQVKLLLGRGHHHLIHQKQSVFLWGGGGVGRGALNIDYFKRKVRLLCALITVYKVVASREWEVLISL